MHVKSGVVCWERELFEGGLSKASINAVRSSRRDSDDLTVTGGRDRHWHVAVRREEIAELEVKAAGFGLVILRLNKFLIISHLKLHENGTWFIICCSMPDILD